MERWGGGGCWLGGGGGGVGLEGLLGAGTRSLLKSPIPQLLNGSFPNYGDPNIDSNIRKSLL